MDAIGASRALVRGCRRRADRSRPADAAVSRASARVPRSPKPAVAARVVEACPDDPGGRVDRRCRPELVRAHRTIGPGQLMSPEEQAQRRVESRREHVLLLAPSRPGVAVRNVDPAGEGAGGVVDGDDRVRPNAIGRLGRNRDAARAATRAAVDRIDQDIAPERVAAVVRGVEVHAAPGPIPERDVDRPVAGDVDARVRIQRPTAVADDRGRGPGRAGVVAVREVDRAEGCAGARSDPAPGDVEPVGMRACGGVVHRERGLVVEPAGDVLDRPRRKRPRRAGACTRRHKQPGSKRPRAGLEEGDVAEVLPPGAVDRDNGIAAREAGRRRRRVGAGPSRAPVRRAEGGDLPVAVVVRACQEH